MTIKQQRRNALSPTVKGSTLTPAKAGAKRAGKGMPGQEQDPKRRLGTFTGTGEHARKGGRTSGIVGQTTKDFGTDNKRTKSTKSRKKPGKGTGKAYRR